MYAHYWGISLLVPMLAYLYAPAIIHLASGLSVSLIYYFYTFMLGRPQEGTLGTFQGVLGVDKAFDYIVVGGGTAGNAIGTRLAEGGFSVAIVEAGAYYDVTKDGVHNIPSADCFNLGGHENAKVPEMDWSIMTEPQAGAYQRRIHISRGKCLGGSSALNGMVYQRPSSQAYDQWAEAVGDDSYRREFFEPYYKKSVNFTMPHHSRRLANASAPDDASDFAANTEGGPVQVGFSNWIAPWSTWVEKALDSAGISKTLGSDRGELLGHHYTRTTIRASDSTRSTSVEYILAAMKKGVTTLKVFTKTQATKILLDGEKRAVGVKVWSKGAEYRLEAANEVIVSAGAFHSPHLLMLSGIGPPTTLKQHGIPVEAVLPGVGQNMWDHVMFAPSWHINTPAIGTVFSRPWTMSKYMKQFKQSRDGPLASNNVELISWEKLPAKYRTRFSPETAQRLQSEFSADWPEAEYMAAALHLGNWAVPALQQPMDGKAYGSILCGLNAPLSRGNVTLKSASPFDNPLVNPNYLSDEADRQVIVAMYRRVRDIWKTPELQAVTIGGEYFPGDHIQTDDEMLDAIRKSLMTIWHPACTCKMGSSKDPMAVVDSQARVFGVDRLRVVDASAFPILPPGHPQATVYALAEKIADAIIKASRSEV
ncbi:hypothetical protein CDD82_7325 [Ophiocordyceps australis]|uniref:Glucose-methanol-choline oxidoreductase N-terminal domain-containing protein n=1 Tax=Ophiocordyceps australis TaxID=1399860 RepID=A0A2C5YV70_9HYPO|nr:hypothetical protein CDD82_7325 [Ophiocordyceps australis]